MNDEKRFYVHIKKSITGFFTVKGKKVRTPVKFVVLESEIPLIKSRMRLESITEYSIIPIIDDNTKATVIV